MKPSLMSVSSFNSRGKVARPDCLTTFEFEGAVLSCSIVHFESPLPVLVAVQPFGAAPITSASKLAVLSAMALVSTAQRNTRRKLPALQSADLTTFLRVSDALFPLSRYTKKSDDTYVALLFLP